MQLLLSYYEDLLRLHVQSYTEFELCLVVVVIS